MFSLMLVAVSAMPQHSKGFIPAGAYDYADEYVVEEDPIVYVEEQPIGFVPVRTVTSYKTGEIIEVDTGNLVINVTHLFM